MLNLCLLAASLVLLLQGSIDCKAFGNEPTLGSNKENGGVSSNDTLKASTCSSDDDCKNGGSCKNNGLCDCPDGTIGDHCEDVPGCEDLRVACEKANGECVFKADAETKAACKCKEPGKVFDSHSNACKGTCNVDEKCLNGGTCSDDNFCSCPDGTTGDHCENVPGCEDLKDACEEANGECVFDAGSTTKAACNCKEPGKVFDSQNNACKGTCNVDDNCNRAGTCGDDHFCSCPDGTAGDHCQEVTGCKDLRDDCEAANGECVFDAGVPTKAACRCKEEGKKYDNQTKACKGTCNVDDNCNRAGTCGDDHFCRCPVGTKGDQCEEVTGCKDLREACEKADADCVHDADAPAGAVCKCREEGRAFDAKSGACKGTCITDEDCYDRETCSANGVCDCVDGTRGDHCEEVTGCEDLGDACEEADAECVYDADAPTKAACKCRERGKKYDSESKVCKETCDGGVNKCRNGAECKGSGRARFCACKPGTSGDLCDVVDDCEDGFCGTDRYYSVVCVYDVDSSRAACKCVDARKKFNPEAKKCQGPCDDDGNRCRNGAECRGSGNATFCACKPGTSGDLCEVVDACEDERFCGRRGDAHCKYNVKLSKAECICKDKAKKFHPKEKKCRETCRKREDCYLGQSCSSDGLCVCPEGFDGVGCKEVAGCRELQKVCDAINADCVFDVNSRDLANCRCREGNAKYDPETRSCEVAVLERNIPSFLFIIILCGVAVILFMSVLFIVLYAFSRRRQTTV